MPRVNVWIPDQLHAAVKRELPRLNMSAVVQGALALKLDCGHHELACADCDASIDRSRLRDEQLGAFFVDAMRAVGQLVTRDVGTAEGAARVLKDIGTRHQITAAKGYPLPRPSRARRKERLDQVVEQLPVEADSRRRHPTARRTA